MKKILTLIITLILCLGAFGCGSKEDTSKPPKENTEVSKEEVKQEKKYYNKGEVVEISTDIGKYKFSVIDAKVIERGERYGKALIIDYEYENIDFKGEVYYNGQLDKDVLYITHHDLKVKDGSQYILDSEWGDDDKLAVPAKAGERCRVKSTFKINETTKLDNVYISFLRMDGEFKVNVE